MSGIRCSRCGVSVSSPVPAGTVVRAWVECPECIERAAPSPVTAAGEEPTAAEQLVNDYERVIMERSQISVFSTHAKARNDARHADIRSRLVAALLGAPAPTSAVPGLREWVREAVAQSNHEHFKASGDYVMGRARGKAEALEAVLKEIDRRSPAPADGGGQP